MNMLFHLCLLCLMYYILMLLMSCFTFIYFTVVWSRRRCPVEFLEIKIFQFYFCKHNVECCNLVECFSCLMDK